MSEDQKKLLEQQLWNIANTLRGKMDGCEIEELEFIKAFGELMRLENVLTTF